MSGKLKYLKDYETSQEYEKLWELILNDLKVVIEYLVQSVYSNRTYQCLGIAELINVGDIVEFEIGYVGNRINSVHSKKLFIGYCKKLNLHYIIPKE